MQQPDPHIKVQQASLGFGHIPGVKVGTIWDSRCALSSAWVAFLLDARMSLCRVDCSRAGVHNMSQAGISIPPRNSAIYGAHSIVLSGGYEDDVDSRDGKTL